MAKRRDSVFQTRVESDQLDAAHEYAESQGVSLGAIVRALFRLLANDPPDKIGDVLPLDEETQRAPYRPRKRRKAKP